MFIDEAISKATEKGNTLYWVLTGSDEFYLETKNEDALRTSLAQDYSGIDLVNLKIFAIT